MNKRKLRLLTAGLLAVSSSTFAQVVPPIEWAYKTLPNVYSRYSLCLSHDDTTLIAAAYDQGIVTYNANNGQAVTFYGGYTGVRPRKVIKIPTGGYIAIGHHDNGDPYLDDGWVAKLDNNLNVVWSQTYGGSSSDYFNNVELIPGESGFMITGMTTSLDGTLTGINTDPSSTSGWGIGWALEIDSIGGIVWQKTVSIPGIVSAYKHKVNETTFDYVLTGRSSTTSNAHVSNPLGGNDFWAASININGTINWQKTYGGSASDWPRASARSNDGNLMMFGTTASNDSMVHNHSGSNDFWLIKININNGDTLWTRAYGGSGNETMAFANDGLSTTQDGGAIITGYLNSDSSTLNVPSFGQERIGGTDYWVLKVDVNGNLQWHKILGSSINDYAYNVVESQNRDYYIVGNSDGTDHDIVETAPNAPGFRTWIVKLSACPFVTTINDIICPGQSYWFIDTSITMAGLYTKTFTSSYGCDSTINLNLNFLPEVQTPIISVNGNILSTGAGYQSYQWLDGNGNAINGATNQTYEVTTVGNYSVVVFNEAGCSDTSDVHNHNSLNIENITEFLGLKIYPNPTKSNIQVFLPNINEAVTLFMYSIDGRLIFEKTVNEKYIDINLSQLEQGIYFLKIKNTKGSIVRKLIKQ